MRRTLARLLAAAVFLTGCAETGTEPPAPKPEQKTETQWVEELEKIGIPRLEISAYAEQEGAGKDVLTVLETGQVYTVHVGGGEDHNIGLQFACDGYVISVTGEDNLTELSVGTKDYGPWDGHTHEPRTVGFTQQIINEGFVSVAPIFCGVGSHLSFPEKIDAWGDTMGEELQKKMSFTGQEYYISVHTYELNDTDTPILRARLKMVQQDDPWQEEDHRSGVFTIELIEYELNDTYKMMLE